MTKPREATRSVRWTLALALVATLPGCEARSAGAAAGAPAWPEQQALTDSAFAALHARLSEEGGYFDTDNLISNETGYLNVQGVLDARAPKGGAYLGVGPDQNFSYIATVEPRIAFIADIRRDNALHHLLLKALMERAPTRVEFLAGLTGRAAPHDPSEWVDRSVEEIAAYVDATPVDRKGLPSLLAEVEAAVLSYGIPLHQADLATIRRYHQTFVEAGLGLRFTSFGRAPRPYYPTYRQLLTETDAEGRPASYLVSRDRYRVVRDLQLANRIVPVVADLAGTHAMREIGRVMGEMGVGLSAIYASNVEFYLWRAGTFGRWLENLAGLPAAPDALLIRSYFPNFGGSHPSALPGYYATQVLQPVQTLLDGRGRGGFSGYWDVVTRDVLELRSPAGVR